MQAVHPPHPPSLPWIGLDISPTTCRVMAKRLRYVCGLPESEPLWRAGRGFVARDLPGNTEITLYRAAGGVVQD